MKPRTSRSLHGCKTCRLRRVKCDETLPHCRRCIDTGRKCDGPSTEGIIIRHYQHGPSISNTRTFLTAAPSLTSSQFAHALEARSFDFYLHRVAPALAGCLDDHLWRILLPQVSHSNKAIRHAILAISTLYEHPLLDAYHRDGIRYSPHQRRAVMWYRASVASALSPDLSLNEREQLESSLLTCLLFISIEIQHAMVSSTLRLLKESYKLIDRCLRLEKSRHDACSMWIEELVCPFLVRQAMLFAVFGHVLPPEFYAVILRAIPSNPESIASLADARSGIYSLLLRSFDLVQIATVSDPTNTAVREHTIDRQSDLIRRLHQWRTEVDGLAKNCHLSQAQLALYHTLVCIQQVANIWLGWLLESPPNEAEVDLSAFSDIIHHAAMAISCLDKVSGNAKSIPFMFEPGVIPPLFFVGWQCRSHTICHQAVALLRRGPAQESLLVAELQANALEKIIAIEQGLVGKIAELDAAEEARSTFFFRDRPIRQVVSKCTLLMSCLLCG